MSREKTVTVAMPLGTRPIRMIWVGSDSEGYAFVTLVDKYLEGRVEWGSRINAINEEKAPKSRADFWSLYEKAKRAKPKTKKGKTTIKFTFEAIGDIPLVVVDQHDVALLKRENAAVRAKSDNRFVGIRNRLDNVRLTQMRQDRFLYTIDAIVKLNNPREKRLLAQSAMSEELAAQRKLLDQILAKLNSEQRRLAEAEPPVESAVSATTCTLASAGLLLVGFIGYHLFKRWRLPKKPIQDASEDRKSCEA